MCPHSETIEIYSVGEILVDMIFKSEVKEGGSVEIHFGGAPANVAVGVARLGHRTGFIGAVGSDSFGDFLIRTLMENNVDASLVKVKKARTTLAIVTVDPSGERKFFFYRKPWTETADTMLTPDDVQLEILKQSKIIHFTGFSMSQPPLSSTVEKILEYAVSNKLLVSYDPTFREDIWFSKEDFLSKHDTALSHANIVSLSIDEIQAIYGTIDYRKIVEKLFSSYPNLNIIAVRLGSKGAYVKTRFEGEAYRDAFKVRAVDTTGAGDAWTAAFLVSYVLEKIDLENAITFANAVAAIKCTGYGAITALPNKEKVRQFLEENNIYFKN
ncbi:MAG: carbohydrate kinase [Thermofilum sp.]|jgi:sugar/nucleoside kinase (ribokinase family)|uniref:carbohydrate kinase family protein n=1 Tax=Thermofilum sp. TaxID=1961369 RepID=UPI00258D2135|nr:carbohydrate kinase [Thermofilum sp.]MCI4407694.1 carbohydrate kinase [Thermofilum sp.]